MKEMLTSFDGSYKSARDMMSAFDVVGIRCNKFDIIIVVLNDITVLVALLVVLMNTLIIMMIMVVMMMVMIMMVPLLHL
jgi:hypothetical protein